MASLRRYLPTRRSIMNHLTDGELLAIDVAFVFLTIAGVLVSYACQRIVTPFPVFFTWWQMFEGLLMACLFGEFGLTFRKFAYFPTVRLDTQLIKSLVLPTCAYCLMLILGNKLLYEARNPAAYPILLTITVIVHHVGRFIGCGEEYLPMRWQANAILLIGFCCGILDKNTVSMGALPYAILYALAAMVFRAGFLQKILHTVDGKGNTLHNHQHIIGSLLLIPAIFLSGEHKSLVSQLPTDFLALYTWQFYGCLIVASTIPFVKNVVSNRLIRRTGQGAWRFLEILSVFLVYIFGAAYFNNSPGFFGFIALLLTIFGRTIGAIDVMRNAEHASKNVNKSAYRSQNSVPLMDQSQDVDVE